MTLSGSLPLTAADIAAGSKTVTLTIYDSDLIFNDPLQTVDVTVPAENGVAGMWTAFQVTADLLNIGHQVAGTSGGSGEQTAEVFFKLPDGTSSNVISITAE